MKTKFLVICLFFLSSCQALLDRLSPDYPTANNFVERFPENKKGIILLKLTSRYTSTTWCKFNEEQSVQNKECIKIKPANYYQIFMLEPAKYELTSYEIYSKRTSRRHVSNPRFSSIDGKRRNKPLLIFDVKDEQISFVGEIIFHDLYGATIQIKDDDFEKIKIAFEKNNQDSLNKFFKNNTKQALILAGKKIFLQKNLAKNKADLQEETRLRNKEERERKKQEKQKFKKLKKQKNDFSKLILKKLN